ncbi:uncharacterized protein LOC129409705 [Boleophthalmus pectinirostris]|uniref:uncharacterized protein LOC129409705 n=1 Tax=Boleophthalmus pectinirostris TaxID=150288 RepID=UPI00242BAC90|nr:uncharacterized protein LOC129409705 [Boleophthalmus pectinirostris]
MIQPSTVLFVLSLVSASKAQVNLHERNHFLLATVGDNITLPCFKSGLDATHYWYKQSLGSEIERISSFSKYYRIKNVHGEFNRNHRFTLDTEHDQNNLNIKHVQMSDSAVYLCISCFLHDLDVIESVTVIVKSLSPTVEVRQSPHEETEPGNNVTLNCSVQTERCEGQHRVHWFKQSEESAAGVLYSHGGGRVGDGCKNNGKSPTNSCVYSLPIHNVNSEQTGTYYCAVAACGQVLFGNGTRITMKSVSDSMVYVLSGVSIFSTSLVVLLTFCFCVQSKTETCMRNFPAKTEDFSKLVQYKTTEQMNRRSRHTPDTWTECVYFSVKKLKKGKKRINNLIK